MIETMRNFYLTFTKLIKKYRKYLTLLSANKNAAVLEYLF